MAAICRRGPGAASAVGIGRRTSSSSAATRCWPPRSSRGCAAAFGVELPLRAVFEAPTVAGLAAGIERALADRERPGRAAAPPGVSREQPAAALLRPAAALVPDQLSRAAAVYNIPAPRAAAPAGSTPARSPRPSARSCAATRRCARPSTRQPASRRRAGDPALGTAALPLIDLSGPAGGGLRGGGAADRRRRRSPAVRPRARPAAARRPAAPGDEEHVALLATAPHRHRRLVDGRGAGARADPALRRLRRRGGRRRCPSCRSSTPTSRSGSGVAVAARCWRSSSPTGAAARRPAARPGAADRPAAPAGPLRPGRQSASASSRARICRP